MGEEAVTEEAEPEPAEESEPAEEEAEAAEEEAEAEEGGEEEEEEEQEEEEEEDEAVDWQEVLREKCREKAACKTALIPLDECTERLEAGEGLPDETCKQEHYDYVHCVDSCVAKTLFTKLK